jgi:putative PIN family toxin of toxin-antitoxin system
MMRVVIDTNVFISSLRSADGASFALMRLIDKGKFVSIASTALLLEYEDIAMRCLEETPFSGDEIVQIIDALFAMCKRQEVYFHWRPQLKDPGDDHVLELAVASSSKYIVTFNKKDFVGIEQFGVQAITPQEFLQKLGDNR